MKAVVVGGGVVGALSAYYLAVQGHSVTLLERNDELAKEASAANANQLSYSHIFPPVSPSIVHKVPSILMGRDPTIKLRSLSDWKFWLWGFQAVPYMLSGSRYRKVSDTLLAIHQESNALMRDFLERHPVEFSRTKTGRVMIYDSPADLNATYDVFVAHGLGPQTRKLSYQETIALEPALQHRTPFAGALYTPEDEIGDCEAFVRGLEKVLKSQGVNIMTSTGVARLIREGGRITGALTQNGEDIEGDIFVLAAGVRARGLLADIGFSVPIYPVKGYTYEIFPSKGQSLPFTASVVDMGLKMVFTPLQNSLKVSNGIFFTRMDRPDDEAFLTHMRKAASSVCPGIDFKDAVLRSGYRPWTPNSLPIIEKRLENLYLNIGHGMLGWTMAQATAKRLADLVRNNP